MDGCRREIVGCENDKMGIEGHLHCVAFGKMCITVKRQETDIIPVYQILPRNENIETVSI